MFSFAFAHVRSRPSRGFCGQSVVRSRSVRTEPALQTFRTVTSVRIPFSPPRFQKLNLLPSDLSIRGQFSRDFRGIWPRPSNKVSGGDELIQLLCGSGSASLDYRFE